MEDLISFDQLTVEPPTETVTPEDTETPEVTDESEESTISPDLEEGDAILEEEEEEEEETEETEDEDKTDPDSVDVPDVKALQGKTLKGQDLDGKDVEINTSTYIPHKVDGKIVNVQIQELLNNYSGSISYEKKFSALDNDKQDFDGRVSTLNEHLQGVFDKAELISKAETPEERRGAAMEVLQMFGSLTGGNSFELVNSLRSAFIDEAKDMADMDEIDLKRHEFELEKRFSDNNKEIDKKRTDQSAKYTEYNNQTTKIVSEHKFDTGEFNAVKSELEGLVSSGKVNAEVTPSTVLEYRTAKLVNESMAEITPELMEDKDFYYKLIDYSIAEKFTKADLQTFLNEVSGQSQKKEKRTRNINRKVKPSKVKKPKAVTKPVAAERSHYSNSIDLWDDV